MKKAAAHSYRHFVKHYIYQFENLHSYTACIASITNATMRFQKRGRHFIREHIDVICCCCCCFCCCSRLFALILWAFRGSNVDFAHELSASVVSHSYKCIHEPKPFGCRKLHTIWIRPELIGRLVGRSVGWLQHIISALWLLCPFVSIYLCLPPFPCVWTCIVLRCFVFAVNCSLLYSTCVYHFIRFCFVATFAQMHTNLLAFARAVVAAIAWNPFCICYNVMPFPPLWYSLAIVSICVREKKTTTILHSVLLMF